MASAVNILQTALQELGTIWKKYRPKKELRPRILKEAYSTFLFSIYYIIAVYITNIFYYIPPMRLVYYVNSYPLTNNYLSFINFLQNQFHLKLNNRCTCVTVHFGIKLRCSFIKIIEQNFF